MENSDNESSRYLMRWPRIGPVDQAVMRLQLRRWTGWLKKRADFVTMDFYCGSGNGKNKAITRLL